LNDLEWLEWSFYVKVSVLQTDFEKYYFILYYLLFTAQSVSVTSEDVGSGVAKRDPQNMWNPRKNCGSFVDAKKANISI